MTKHMLPEHIRVFQAAARHFDVHILVRRTNLASLRFAGAKDCVPKRLDCKAKTADLGYTHPTAGQIDCAGLVVDPTITGPGVFASTEKYKSALKEWGKFSATIHPQVTTHEGQKSLTYIPGGRHYFVDLHPTSPRHGCVKLTTSGLITAGKYIHGDFDLYGIIPATDPSKNVAVFETMLGQAHSRSPEFQDVQIYINSRIGVPMILHGAQEAYADGHSDEGIDIFWSDGTTGACESAAEIAAMYETLFGGRQLFTRDGPKVVVRGGYLTPA